MHNEDEIELDFEMGGKVLKGDEVVKKKPRAKAKAKVKKETPKDVTNYTDKTNLIKMPLSLQSPTSEDIAQFEIRYNNSKSQISHARDYAPSSTFKVGEIIKHKQFGVGFVVVNSSSNKIEVLFEKGRKLLIHNLNNV